MGSFFGPKTILLTCCLGASSDGGAGGAEGRARVRSGGTPPSAPALVPVHVGGGGYHTDEQRSPPFPEFNPHRQGLWRVDSFNPGRIGIFSYLSPRAPGHFPAPKASLMPPEGRSGVEAPGWQQEGLRVGKWTGARGISYENYILIIPEQTSFIRAGNDFDWPTMTGEWEG